MDRNPFNGSNMLINISAGEVYNSTVNVHNTKDIRCLISGMKGLLVFDLPFKKKVTTEAIPTNHCQGEWNSSTAFFAVLSQTYSHRQTISRRTETRKIGNWSLLQLQTGQEGHSSSPKKQKTKKMD